MGPDTQPAHFVGALFLVTIFLLSVRVRKGGVGISDLSYDAMPILSHNRVSGPYEKSLKRQNRFAHWTEGAPTPRFSKRRGGFIAAVRQPGY